MAVDTRDKRFAMVGLVFPSMRVMPNPDGTFNEANDRVHLLYVYRAALDLTPSGGGGTENYLLRRRRADR